MATDPSQSSPFLLPSPPDTRRETSITRKPMASAVAAGGSQTDTVERRRRTNNAGIKDNHLVFTLQDVAGFVFQLVALVVALVFGAWAIKSYDAALQGNDLAQQSYQAALKGNEMADSSQRAADQQASLQSQKVALQNQVILAQGQLAMLQYCHAGRPQSDSTICDAIIAALPIASIASVLSIAVPSFASTTDASATLLPTASNSATASSTFIGSAPSDIPAPSGSASLAPLGLGSIIAIIIGVVATLGGFLALVLLRLKYKRRALSAE